MGIISELDMEPIEHEPTDHDTSHEEMERASDKFEEQIASYTISDIVAMLRSFAHTWSGLGGNDLRAVADRIEAETKFVTQVAERADHDLAKLNAENDRLRAALRPVLECPIGYFGSSVDAVRECQRIYNESEAV